MVLWPNPNRGDRFDLGIDHVADGITTVALEVFDLSGARIVARTIPVQYGRVNTVVQLDGGLAAGTYLVRILAGNEQYNKRLVIQH